jgi:hypothetical protein
MEQKRETLQRYLCTLGNTPNIILFVEQKNVNQANIFGNNRENDSELIMRLIDSYEKQLHAKDEQIKKLIDRIG